MSIVQRIFGMTPTATPAAPAQQPNNLQTPPTKTGESGPGTEGNGVIPNDGSAKPPADKSPLAQFGTLWEPPATPEGKENPDNSGTIDPSKVMEAAGKVNFANVVNQETLAKITAGGEGAVNALIDALNKTSQTVFAQSTIAAQRIADRAVKDAEERLNSQLPETIRRKALENSLTAKNPAFSNPAIKPLIDALQNQIAEKYPKATQAELETMAQEYLTGAANLIAPPQKDGNSTPAQKAGKDDVNWEAWLSQDNPKS